MPSIPRSGLLAALLALGACGRAATSPPPRAPEAAEETDAGLPRPPRSTERGVIVPSDLGVGAGVSGPATPSATSSPITPAVGGPPAVGH